MTITKRDLQAAAKTAGRRLAEAADEVLIEAVKRPKSGSIAGL